jgi:phosphoribosylformylglycinamidine synthase
MAVASGVGAVVAAPEGADIRWLFGESPSRFVLAVDPPALGELHRRAAVAGVQAVDAGAAGGDRLVVTGAGPTAVDVAVAAATAAWRGRLPELLGHGTTQG